MSSILFDILATVVIISAVFWALVRYLESAGVFFPNRQLEVSPSVLGLPWEDVYFDTKDHVSLNGWFFKNPQATSTLIFAHGNAGNMGDRLFKIQFLYELALNVFIFDYRGYGKSQGIPSEAGIYRDAQAAYDYLKARGDTDMERIIIYGASLGGAVAIDLATQRKAALLIVESSITNALDMAHIHYPFVPSFFLRLKFDSVSKVKQLTVPKLFIHSPGDEVVPYWVGKKLFAAAAEPKRFLKISGAHNDASIASDPAAMVELVRALKSEELI